jgi:hypothetical protein
MRDAAHFKQHPTPAMREAADQRARILANERRHAVPDSYQDRVAYVEPADAASLSPAAAPARKAPPRREWSAPVVMAALMRLRRIVAEHFELTPDDLASESRRMRIVRARWVGMYLSRKLKGRPSYSRIGDAYRRDHSTVIHGIRTAEAMIVINPAFAADVAAIATLAKGKGPAALGSRPLPSDSAGMLGPAGAYGATAIDT